MKTKPAVVILVAVAALLQTATNHAQTMNPPYLSGMPTVERVMREIQGKDSIDTAARQAGAFWQLRKVIFDIALSQRRNDRQVTPDEKRLVDAYLAAYYNVWLPLEKSLAQDRPRLFKLQGYTVDDRLLEELFTKAASPAVRAEYVKANAAFAARHKQVEEEGKAQQAKAQAERQAYMEQQKPKAYQRELARCVAAGRSPAQCIGDSLGKGLSEFMSAIDPSAKKAAPGLRMGGAYPGPGGFGIKAFGPSVAVLNCKGASNFFDYTVDRKDSRVLVSLLQKNGEPVVLEFRADGKLDGKGQGIVVTQSSTREVGTTTEKGIDLATGRPATKTTHTLQTDTSSQRCSIGLLGPGAVPDLGVFGQIADEVGKETNAKNFKVIPGLRMGGEYSGQGGFSIEFHNDSAVLECGEAVVAQPYTVERKGNQFMVNIQHDARPIVLELLSDGTLAGSGPVQVNGRVLVGRNARDEFVFEPRSASCAVGILSPGSAGLAGTATSPHPGAAPRPSGTGGASTAPKPSGAAGSATLTMTLGIPNRPGQVLLPGQVFMLLNENFETALKQQGFEPSSGASILKSAGACNTATPNCQKVAAAIKAHSVGAVRVDPEGKANFPGVAPGTYFVVSRLEYPAYSGRILIFNVRVDLKPGSNSVTVDQRNATPIN